MADVAGFGKQDLYDQLLKIEGALTAGWYRPGPWARFVRAVRRQPDEERRALAADISRVSRKLHLRNGRRTIPVVTGLAIELVAIVIGAVILVYGLAAESNTALIVTMAIWVVAFQPPLKVTAGVAMGIGYDYAYLYGVEPRFKMSFGSYLAAPRWQRIVLHLSGMVGSPLGAIIVATIAGDRFQLAAKVCWWVLWIVIGVNVLPTIAALFGVRRIGPFRSGDSSGTALAIEVREALGL